MFVFPFFILLFVPTGISSCIKVASNEDKDREFANLITFYLYFWTSSFWLVLLKMFLSVLVPFFQKYFIFQSFLYYFCTLLQTFLYLLEKNKCYRKSITEYLGSTNAIFRMAILMNFHLTFSKQRPSLFLLTIHEIQ